MKNKRELIVVDPDTGEVLDPARVVYLDDGDQVIRKAQRDYAAKKKARYEDTTSFVWAFFKYGKPC